MGEQLGTTKIDALVLNAGTQFPNGDTRTPDGFEATFAINHLAHYLLLRLLLPQLAPGAVVVLTTSGTHDPAERTILPPPRHADACMLAHPDQDPYRDQAPIAAAGRAYASSKLCNLLTARALAAHPEAQAHHLTALAYDPGPTPGTGLVRNSGFAVRLIWRTLAALALGQIRPPAGHVYAALRRGRLIWANPSELARRDDVMKQLWQDSAALVGLSEEMLAESHCKI